MKEKSTNKGLFYFPLNFPKKLHGGIIQDRKISSSSLAPTHGLSFEKVTKTLSQKNIDIYISWSSLL